MSIVKQPANLPFTIQAEDAWGSLMAAALAGERRAYDRLLSEIRPWLNRYFVRRLPAGMADDAVQECLFAVHSKRHNFQQGRPLKPWLAGIARFKWIDKLRGMKRSPTVSIESNFLDPAIDGHEESVTSAIVLDALLKQLKPAQSQAIRLVKIQGFSIREAATISGQSEPLVKVNIHRGLSKLSRFTIDPDASENA